MPFITILIPICALAWDLLLGDPPNRLHPVCLVGNEISWLWKKRPSGRISLFLWGVFLVAAVCLPPLAIGAAVMSLPAVLGVILSIPLFKASFSLRGLFEAGREIQSALEADDLKEARRLTGWHLVSRDTLELTEEEITGCVIESIAENLTDSLISPWVWFLAAGLPGALLCRAVNTCDAMIGYRKDDYEWGGKAAAWLDDIIHWIPARITALLICLAAGQQGKRAFRTMMKDRKKTDSPNAGWTMAAAAGALDIRLEKRNQYILNEKGGRCGREGLSTMFFLLKKAAALGVILIFLTLGGLLWLI